MTIEGSGYLLGAVFILLAFACAGYDSSTPPEMATSTLSPFLKLPAFQ
jgi:hypothetical protein